MDLETEKDMQDEHVRRASVILLFQFVIPASRSRCQRDRFPKKILQVECLVEGQRLGAEYHLQKTESQ